jgi:hypothetical protein
MLLHIFLTKPLVYVSVCYTPTSGRISYTCLKLKADSFEQVYEALPGDGM